MDRQLLCKTIESTPITAEVVNVIPGKVYENVFQKNIENGSIESITGRIDNGSKLSFLVDPLTNEMYIWKTETKRYVDDINYTSFKKEYCSIALSSSDKVDEKQIVLFSTDKDTICSVIYGSSSGFVYFWDDVRTGKYTGIQLEMESGEEVTCVTPLKATASSIENAVMVGTSQGRIFLVVLKLRPVIQLTSQCLIGGSSTASGSWLSYISSAPKPAAKVMPGIHSIIALEDEDSSSNPSFMVMCNDLELRVYCLQQHLERNEISGNELVRLPLHDQVCGEINKDCGLALLKTAFANGRLLLSIRDTDGCIYVVSLLRSNWELLTCTIISRSSSSSNPALFMSPDSQTAFVVLQNPLTISAIHLPLNQIYTFDLPSNVVPGVLNGCCGTPPYSDGMLFIASAGSVIHLRVKLTCMYRGGTVLDGSALAEVLLSHFESYARDSTTGNTLNSSNALAPFLQLSAAALNAVIENASSLLLAKAVSDQTPRDVLMDKLSFHKRFLKFLYYSGLYKHLSTSRCTLRDHGELITCAIAVIDCFSTKSFASKDLFRNADFPNPLQLPHILSSIVASYPQDQYFLDLTNILLTVTSSIIQSRQQTTVTFYDTPLLYNELQYRPPWTCDEDIRTMFKNHIYRYSTSKKHDGLQTLSSFLLDSYHDQPLQNLASDQQQLCKESYHQAKEVSIPKIQLLLGTDTAYQLSLDHLYFYGIVDIGTSTAHLNNNYTLSYLLSNPDSHSVTKSIDYTSNLSLIPYLFTHCLQSKKFANLLDYGQLSPHEFLMFLAKHQHQMSSYSWLFYLRQKNYTTARSQLVNLSSDFTTARSSIVSLSHQELMLSFAKVASKLQTLSTRTTSDAFMISAAKNEGTKIQNGFLLLHAQQILFPDTTDSIVHISQLNTEVYHRLSPDTTNVTSEDRVHAALIGLAISEVNGINYPFTQVYRTCILHDLDEWKDLAQDASISSNDDIKYRIRQTIFYQVYQSYKFSKEDHARNSNSSTTGANMTVNMINKILQPEEDGDRTMQDLETMVSIAVRLAKEESTGAMQ